MVRDAPLRALLTTRQCWAASPLRPDVGASLFEPAYGPFDVPGFLDQRFRIPFAAPTGSEEIAAVDVNSTREPRDRIGHRVNDVVPERLGIALTERLGAGGFDPAAWNAPPENVVLTARVDADHRPHLMIVRHQRHHRRPDHIEDRQLVGLIELMQPGVLRLAKTL